MNMYKFSTFFLAMLMCLAAISCGEQTVEIETVTLSSTPSELVFAAQGGTSEITIVSGIDPTVSCSEKWITLSKGSFASNSVKVSVTAAEHTGTSARSASIRVIGDKQSLMIPVTQNVAEVTMAASQSSVAFDRFGGETVITVTSSSQPAVSTDASWCLVSAGSIGSNKETAVTVSAPANRTASSLSGTVTVSCGSQSLQIPVSLDAYAKPETVSAAPLSQEEIFLAMAPGWNMGNHMDAVSNGVAGETLWGNPKCTQSTFDGLKAAGFKAVRICVTWAGHIGDAPSYRLDENWLGRVEEIVGYAEKAGLVAIVNTHHDESYWLDINKAKESTKDEIFCVWTQIAQRFADKGDWLVMESFNEIQDGGWGWSTAFRDNPQAQYDILNSWNQVFVDAVRATGGNNATRALGIPGYAASPSFTIAGLVLPSDYTTGNRLIVAVHDYDPYNYTLADPLVRQWGHTADADKRCSDTDEKNITDVFDALKAAYQDKDIPVYLGEMGCSRHTAADMPYQLYYMEYFCKAAADYRLPMYVWDNGAVGTGSETHAYIDHGTGAIVDDTARQLIEKMVKAVTTTDAAYTLESVYNSAP